MGLFGNLKRIKPVGFTYQPRFYDEKKEAFQNRLKNAQELVGDDPEALKARIRRSMQRRSSLMTDKKYRQQRVVRSNLFLVFIIGVLVVITFAVLDIYLPKLLEYLGR